jgi:hypothetical protein
MAGVISTSGSSNFFGVLSVRLATEFIVGPFAAHSGEHIMRKKDSALNPPLKPYQSTLAARPEYATAIGMVSIEIANLEILLGELLAALLHIDPHFGRIVYLTPQSNMARIQIVENVLGDTLMEGSEGRLHVEGLLARAKSVVGKRHELMHNAWGVSSEDREKVARRSLPFKASHPAKQVPIVELNDLVGKIRVLCTEIVETTGESLRSWPPYTWQPIPNEQSPDGQNRKSGSPRKGRVPKPQRPRGSSRA